ncbi:MAG: ABC transporter permease [Chloroflexota bacterium]
MTRLIIQRIGSALLTMILVSVIAFIATEALPGDSCTAFLGRQMTPETYAVCVENQGLDRSVVVRYYEWVSSFVQGDLGSSMMGDRDIGEIVGSRLRNTVLLTVVSAAIGIPLAIFLGVLTGLMRDRFADVAISTTAIAAMTLPEFVTATVLIYVLSIRLDWFPAIAILRTNATFMEVLPNIALPVITLVLVMTAHILRMVRTSVIDVMASDFVQMARLKGVPYWRIVFRHALPNAMLPSIPVIALTIAWLLGGVVIIERVFNYPGLGNEMLEAIADRDLPLVLAIAMLLAAVYVGVNFISDLLTLILNPKLRTMRA